MKDKKALQKRVFDEIYDAHGSCGGGSGVMKIFSQYLKELSKTSTNKSSPKLPNIVETISHIRSLKVKPDEDYIVLIVSNVYEFIVRNFGR